MVATWLEHVQGHTVRSCPDRLREDVVGDVMLEMCAAALSVRGVEKPAALAATIARHRVSRHRAREDRETVRDPALLDRQAHQGAGMFEAASVPVLPPGVLRGATERWVWAKLCADVSFVAMSAECGQPAGRLHAIAKRIAAKVQARRAKTRRLS